MENKEKFASKHQAPPSNSQTSKDIWSYVLCGHCGLRPSCAVSSKRSSSHICSTWLLVALEALLFIWLISYHCHDTVPQCKAQVALWEAVTERERSPASGTCFGRVHRNVAGAEKQPKGNYVNWFWTNHLFRNKEKNCPDVTQAMSLELQAHLYMSFNRGSKALKKCQRHVCASWRPQTQNSRWWCRKETFIPKLGQQISNKKNGSKPKRIDKSTVHDQTWETYTESKDNDLIPDKGRQGPFAHEGRGTQVRKIRGGGADNESHVKTQTGRKPGSETKEKVSTK